jgi:hypothetical protein
MRTCPTHGALSPRSGRKNSWYCKPCKNARERARENGIAADGVPETEGFRIRATSTLYDAEGEVKQRWVKEDRGAALLEELRAAVVGIAEPFRAAHKPVPAPTVSNDDLLCLYPLGDPHIGMYAWAEETGQSFDLDIAERNLVAAADHLVSLAPPAKQALIINLGDFFHADNSSNKTLRSGNVLDVDTRWAKVLRVGVRIMRRLIDRALEKHGHVTVICEIGNHDDHSAVMLALCLEQYYESEPRVTIDTSPAKFHWYRFGNCLIGTTHLDTVKAQDLPSIMAYDRKEDWGETEFRYFFTGHLHTDILREYRGCFVETVRTLAPSDAWSKAAGYRSGQDMKVDVLHRKWGRINRHTVGIRQIWDQAGNQ